MDSVIFVSEKRLSETDVASFVKKQGGKWHADPPSPNGIVREGDDVIYFYPPMLPSAEYSPEEIEEIVENEGEPMSLVLIDIGRSDGSPDLAARIGKSLIDMFGGWLDGNGVLD